MGPRKCTIEGCKSVSGRPQHRGVTFHTIPNNPVTRHNWMVNCRMDMSRKITKSVLICSRHFLRVDFQTLNNNKYMLKQGAEPTIFPWTHASNAITTAIRASDGTSSSLQIVPPQQQQQQQQPPAPSPASNIQRATERIVNRILEDALKENKSPIKRSASADVASNEPKPKVIRKSLDSAMAKRNAGAAAASNIDPSSLFRPGGDIEAMDFNGVWHPANVVEVDNEDSEVLIHFNTANISLIDEWIPMKSSRLRAAQPDQPLMPTIDEAPEMQIQIPVQSSSPSSIVPAAADLVQQQIMQPLPLQSNLPVLKKAPYNYVVGERCLAKWNDSRRWKATVQTVLDLDYYDVLFDDGYTKRCHAKDMSKIKRPQPAPPTPAKPIPASTGRKINPPLPIPKFDLSTLDLLPVPKDGEWCCNWVNDTPIGAEGYLEGPDGNRRPTVLVDDWRLPPGWTKHLYQRSSVSGKWDVVLVGPTKKRFRSKNDVKVYLDEHNIPYNPDVYDFSIHKRRAKDLGLFIFTEDYKEAQHIKQQQLLQSQAEQRNNFALPSDTLNQSINSDEVFTGFPPTSLNNSETSALSMFLDNSANDTSLTQPPEEGYVYVGSLKVRFEDDLYYCPHANCNKNFRKDYGVQMHIKHYHRDLSKQVGACPNMSDLAYLRTTGEMPMDDGQNPALASPKTESVSGKAKTTDIIQTIENQPKIAQTEIQQTTQHPIHGSTSADVSVHSQSFIRTESPALHENLAHQPYNNADQLQRVQSHQRSHHKKYKKSSKAVKNRLKMKMKNRHGTFSSKSKKSRSHHSRSAYSSDTSHNEYEYDPPYRGYDNPSLTPHKSSRLKYLNSQMSALSDPNVYEPHVQQPAPPSQYIDENGEVIKIVRMRQEEIINCICAYAEEDGLMIQCELCLCWQHGFCHGIEKESLVPEKYVCYICQNPQSGRPSMKYIHDQEWLYDGRLPVATKWQPPAGEVVVDDTMPTVHPKHKERFDKLKHSHRLTGNLLDLKRFMHSLQVKINIAENKDHPKMYLWAKKWERSPPQSTNEVAGIEPLVSTNTASEDKKIIITDTELNDILHQDEDKKLVEVKSEFQSIDSSNVVDNSVLVTADEVQVINDLMTNEEAMKHMEQAAQEIENCVVKQEDLSPNKNNATTSKCDDAKDCAGDVDSNMLAGLLTSPGGTNIDLVGEIKVEPTSRNRHNIEVIVPQPEAAIDPTECQMRLLDHIQKQQMLAMARLQAIEADITGLEAMDEHAEQINPDDSFSATKQTIFQLLSDLTKIRKLAAINVAEDEQLANMNPVL